MALVMGSGSGLCSPNALSSVGVAHPHTPQVPLSEYTSSLHSGATAGVCGMEHRHLSQEPGTAAGAEAQYLVPHWRPS